jgi:hypothetical protein
MPQLALSELWREQANLPGQYGGGFYFMIGESDRFHGEYVL